VAIEKGRIVTRDIAGSDPERMAAPRVAEYLQKEFRDTDIFMNVTSSQEEFKRNYPLIAAVNRAAYTVERHRARLIKLEYTGEGEIDVTYFLVGKGITFDTGGADLKTGGSMKSMHRDKSGAATVAGFFKILSELKPKGIKVVGQLPMVRNSIGADSYLSDEIITSAAGVRVRIMNTDAEGRNVMVDPLHYAKLMAMNEKNPHITTIATLSGSAVRCAGPAYSVVMENGVARNIGFAEKLQAAGEDVAEPFELSRLRREDYAFIRGRSEYEDVIQSSSRKSSSVFRGHQFPCAFMIRASGLDKHGISSKKPLKYTHLDIAGPAVFTYPGIPNARPLVALCKALKVF
jgi:leucyl aminopeptidase